MLKLLQVQLLDHILFVMHGYKAAVHTLRPDLNCQRCLAEMQPVKSWGGGGGRACAALQYHLHKKFPACNTMNSHTCRSAVQCLESLLLSDGQCGVAHTVVRNKL